MLETGFVTHSEYQKHIRGEWRTVHDLWRHIRNYMTSYAQPGGFTQGSIAYADADGFLTENNAQLYWDAAQHFLGVGVGAPECRTHIRIAVCADYDDVLPDVALLLENDANVRLQLQAATTGTAYIEFCSDENNPPAGRVAYDFPNDQLEFGIGGNEILRLKVGPTFDYAGTLTLDGIVAIAGTSINLRNNAELRFYDNGNYVGFEAPALGADQIWVLPNADGPANEAIGTDGAGNLIWRTHDELAGYAAGEHFTMLDEDNFVSDSDTQAATQQSIKAYIASLGIGAATFVALTDTPANYVGSAGKFVKVNATPDALEFADIAWADVSKVGSNLTDLATRQHAGLTDVTSDQHHAQVHALAGGDHSAAGLTIGHVIRASGAAAFAWAQLQHGDLGGVTSDLHHAQLHEASHRNAGADELSHDALKDFVGAEHLSLPNSMANVINAGHTKALHDGLGLSHDSLVDVSIDDHHAQSHTLASHSTKPHSALSDAPADAHHPQTHTLASHTSKDHHLLAGLGDDDHSQYYNAARHTKALHDVLNIDADKVDGEHASAIVTKARVDGVAADHGVLSGKGDDDHSQYYNAARHTKAVHDALAIDHGSLGGRGDDDHSIYYNAARHTKAVHDALLITILGSGALAKDHGAAATDMLVNVCYGTGAAPAAGGTTHGTIFLKYTA